MRKSMLTLTVGALLLPVAAVAQPICTETRASGGQGAVGQILGALGEAFSNGQAASTRECVRWEQRQRPDAYGYYDEYGVWHVGATRPNPPAGYYDRSGKWVSGYPNGYYDGNGNWVAASGDPASTGYYDNNGYWVPATARGYYGANGQPEPPTYPGYWDSNGRWVAGAIVGHYDASGRWISGEPAWHQDSARRWVPDPQPGYYDASGHWRAGTAWGYYDSQGRWVETPAPAAGRNSTSVTNSSPTYNVTRNETHVTNVTYSSKKRTRTFARHHARRHHR
jgi:hypothetical protein